LDWKTTAGQFVLNLASPNNALATATLAATANANPEHDVVANAFAAAPAVTAAIANNALLGTPQQQVIQT
jgi:hypothetical protein